MPATATPRRPAARLLAAAPTGGDATRWLLSTGAPTLTTIDGVNDGRPVLLVIDLATLAWPKASVPLFIDHQADTLYDLAGAWDDLRVDATGLTALPRAIPADATGYRPWAADLAARIIDNRLPVQASVGIGLDPDRQGTWETLTAASEINGRTIDPAAAPGLPVVVLRQGLLGEASLVLWGADHRTGAQLAAPRPPIPADERLRAALARYPDHAAEVARAIADGADDTAIGERIHTAQLAARDTRITTLTAELDQARARLAALPVTPVVVPTPAAPATPLPGGSASGAGEQVAPPATLMAALAQHRAELEGAPTHVRIARMKELYPHLRA